MSGGSGDPSRQADKAALCFGTVTTVAMCCIGCDLASAAVVGALVAAIIDVPFGSIMRIGGHR